MKYRSGETVEIGDNVLIEKGRTKGVVKLILETKQDLLDWGLDEDDDFCVILESEPFGLVSDRIDDGINYPTIFVSRKRD